MSVASFSVLFPMDNSLFPWGGLIVNSSRGSNVDNVAVGNHGREQKDLYSDCCIYITSFLLLMSLL